MILWLPLTFETWGINMGHFARLQLVGRLSYYLGWIALVCGALVHLKIGQTIFLALSLTKRNLIEISLICFVICMASMLRAIAPAQRAASSVIKSELAA